MDLVFINIQWPTILMSVSLLQSLIFFDPWEGNSAQDDASEDGDLVEDDVPDDEEDEHISDSNKKGLQDVADVLLQTVIESKKTFRTMMSKRLHIICTRK